MANRRLRMRQIRDILRLQWSVGLSMRSIAQSLGVGYGTVHDVLHRAAAADLRWPLPAELDDGELEGLLYQGHQGRPRRRPDPDWAVVDMELRRKGVTLELLWLEYKQAHPAEGYQYSQFCFHYRQWRQAQNVVLRQSYRGGEKMFVDYAGRRSRSSIWRRARSSPPICSSRRQQLHLLGGARSADLGALDSGPHACPRVLSRRPRSHRTRQHQDRGAECVLVRART